MIRRSASAHPMVVLFQLATEQYVDLNGRRVEIKKAQPKSVMDAKGGRRGGRGDRYHGRGGYSDRGQYGREEFGYGQGYGFQG